jgi:large repetitive protein
MHKNLPTNRLLAGLAVSFLVVGCASGATALPSSPAVATPTPTAMPSATSLTGSMTTARLHHTATLLADGRVLVAGGYGSHEAPLASAELYDSKTGSFSPTGSLAGARGFHTATRLSDGRVLIAGGGEWDAYFLTASFLASAELYDPKTGSFSPTGSMTTTREGHTATLLLDGRVLITGGNDTSTDSLASAELFDPKTGTFSPTGSLATARGFHTATLLSDGRVLIAGGDSGLGGGSPHDSAAVASAELYDPKTGTFSPTGSLAVARDRHTATLLSDGRVLIAGGRSLASAELYDPKTGKFSPTGSMATGRYYPTAVLLSDGRVLVAGGYDAAPVTTLASADLYDPKTGTFSPTGSLATARGMHTATLLADGRVLIAGGDSGLGGHNEPVVPLASAELYDPATGKFSPAG